VDAAGNKRLWIVGAGDFGREVRCWASDIPPAERDWTVAGYLDDDPAAARERLSQTIIDEPEVRERATYVPQPEDLFICAIGDPGAKLRICHDLLARGARFTNVIHPTAVVGPGCHLGTGIILCPYVIVTTGVTLQDFVTINLHSTVGHDAWVGEGTTLSTHCSIAGRGRLERGVFMGDHASVLPSAHVGKSARVGAGTVVLKSAPAHKTVFGVPGRVV
jgi:sugar O-acyltransferase (sialic acid O-acetyltransferase NeuD family)